MQLSNNQTITDNQNFMNSRDFKKFMKNEHEKGEFNQKLNDHNNATSDMNQIIHKNKHMIETLNDVVKKMSNEKISFTGTVLDIKKQVSDYQKKIGNHCTKTHELMIENSRDTRLLNDVNEKFESETLIPVMNIEIYENTVEENKRKKIEAKDENWKKFLKRVAQLPDDLLKTIQSYFMYETKAAILEHKYNPIKLFHSLNKKLLNRYIYQIYHKIYKMIRNRILYKKMTVMWKGLYNTTVIQEIWWKIPPLKKLKSFIQYLFILFRKYDCDQYCFDLYRDIAILKKP
jgi:hypothetical protein